MSLFFYLFTFAINLWDWKFVTADVTVVFVKINTAFSDENKILIKEHLNTLSIHSYTRRGIKIGALKMQCLHFRPHVLNICRKFEFLISKGSVATCLR